MSAVHVFDLKAYQPETTYISKKHKVTEEEYWDKYYDYPEVTYEWNNGELEEKGGADIVTVSMYIKFLKLLEYYLETHPIAQSTMLQIGFRLTLSQKNKVRRPDLGVVKNDNPIPLKPLDKSYKGIYDLCVEAISGMVQFKVTMGKRSPKRVPPIAKAKALDSSPACNPN